MHETTETARGIAARLLTTTHDPAQRREALASLEPSLRGEVERWLSKLDATQAPVRRDGAAASDAQAARPDSAGGESTPADALGRIGRYTLLAVIGEGGMGTVYLAEQDAPRRRVALKLIRGERAGAEARRRFAHEAEFLARIEDPAVARIYEAGIAQGPRGETPFLVMEYIDGEDLLTYAQRHALDARARLQLVARIARGVHQAHTKGIVHRDLKPGNVLVDAGGQPKILDFGIAQPLDDAALRMTAAGELLGTIAYMSPEQLAGDPRRIDTRSDVYALGVIAYELLSGKLPYAVGDDGRVADVLKRLDARALVPLAQRVPALRGDVSTIVAKALDDDPARRYQSAADLAADLERFLAHRPIEARPASASYLAWRFAQRHRFGVAAAAIVAIALVAATVFSIDAARVASAARAEAERRAHIAEATSRFVTTMLGDANPEARALGELSVRELVDSAAASVSPEITADPQVGVAILSTLGGTYTGLGEFARARELLERAVSLAGAHATDDIGAEARRLQAVNEGAAGENARAEALYAALVADLAPTRAADDAVLQRVLASRGNNLIELGRGDEAVATLEALLARVGPQSVLGGKITNDLAIHWHTVGDFARAETLLRGLVAYRERTLGDAHPDTLNARNSLGTTLQQAGRRDAAEAEFRAVLAREEAALGESHPATLTSAFNLANLLLEKGALDEGAPLARRTLTLAQARFSENHPLVQSTINTYAYLLEELGQYDEAEVQYRRAIAVQDRIGSDKPDALAARNNLAMLLLRADRLGEADAAFRDLLARAKTIAGEDSPYYGIFADNYGECLTRLRRYDEAARVLAASHATLVATLGADHPRVAKSNARLEALRAARG